EVERSVRPRDGGGVAAVEVAADKCAVVCVVAVINLAVAHRKAGKRAVEQSPVRAGVEVYRNGAVVLCVAVVGGVVHYRGKLIAAALGLHSGDSALLEVVPPEAVKRKDVQ